MAKLTDKVNNSELTCEWLNREYFDIPVKLDGVGSTRMFCVAGKEYDTGIGKVTVLFNSTMAFVLTEEVPTVVASSIWGLDDLRNAFKKGDLTLNEFFPAEFIDSAEVICDMSGNEFSEVIERLDLAEHMADIKERLNDLVYHASGEIAIEDGKLVRN